MSAAEALASGLAALGLTVPAAGQRKLLDYLRLMDQWNRVYNLSGIRSEATAVSVHLLDSLALISVMPEVATVDVGSGAGLPGVPLAIARSRVPMTMIESNGKKAAFIRHVVSRLALANAEVVEERVERWQPERRFPAIVSRAFADLADVVRVSAHLIAAGGRFYAMKGRLDRSEVDALPSAWRVVEVRPLVVPGVEGQRHVVVVGEAGA
jgi:16S rRNA (guanine527-N7)-methyltransferase